MPKPSGAHDHGLRARVERRHRFPDSVVGGQPCVREGRYVLRFEDRVELHNRPGVGLEEVGESAVAGEAGELAVLAVHVVAGPARAAEATSHEGVADHRVPHGYVGDGRADLLDPAGVFVSRGVG